MENHTRGEKVFELGRRQPVKTQDRSPGEDREVTSPPSPPQPAPRTCGGGDEMAELDWILERERRQMELILELDMEELQVEEVDDAGSSSSSDVDTFLRSTHPWPLLTIPCKSGVSRYTVV
jgi:hypothetical protein